MINHLFCAHVDQFHRRRDIINEYLDEVLTTGLAAKPKHGDVNAAGMIYHGKKDAWVSPKHKDIDSRGRMFHKKHGWIAGDATAGEPIVKGRKLSQPAAPAKEEEPENSPPPVKHNKKEIQVSSRRSDDVAKMLFQPIGQHGGSASDRGIRKAVEPYGLDKEAYDRHHGHGIAGTHADDPLKYEDHVNHLIKTGKIKTNNPNYAAAAAVAYRAGRSMAAYRKAHSAIPNIHTSSDLDNHVKDLKKNLEKHGVGEEGIEHAVRAFTNSHAEHHTARKINSASGAAIDLPNGNKAQIVRYSRGKLIVRHPNGIHKTLDLDDDLDTEQKTKLLSGDVKAPESLLKAGAITFGKPSEHHGVTGKGTHSTYHTILPTTHEVDGEHGYHVRLERNAKHVEDLLDKLNKSAKKHEPDSHWTYDGEKDQLTLHDNFGHHKFAYDGNNDHNWHHATSHARGSIASGGKNPKYDIQGGESSLNKAIRRGKGLADVEPEERVAAHHQDKASLSNLKHRVIPLVKNAWREITKNSWRAARVRNGEMEDLPIRIAPKKGFGHGFHLPLTQRVTHTPPTSSHDPKWEEWAKQQVADPRTDRIEYDKKHPERIAKVHVFKRNYTFQTG